MLLNELFEAPVFKTGSHDTRKKLFGDWMDTEFVNLTQGLDKSDLRVKRREAKRHFNSIVPTPESSAFDAVDALQVGVNNFGSLARSTVGFIDESIPQVAKDFVAPTGGIIDNAKQAFNTAIGDSPNIQQYTGNTTEDRRRARFESSDSAGSFNQSQHAQQSDYRQDKRLQKQEAVAGKEGLDVIKASAGFYADNKAEAVYGALESAPSTLAAMFPAAKAAQLGKYIALLTGFVTEGTMGGAEARGEAVNTIAETLIQDGVDKDTALEIANIKGNDAFEESFLVSGALGQFSEAGLAAKVFSKTNVNKGGFVKRPLTAIKDTALSSVGEGIQGASSKIASNRAVNDVVTGVGDFDGAALAGVDEAIMSTPVTGGLSTFNAITADNVLPQQQSTVSDTTQQTPDLEEIIDSADEIVNQEPEAQDNGDIFQDETDQSGVDSADSVAQTQREESTGVVNAGADTTGLGEVSTNNRGLEQTIPDSEQQTGTSPSAVENPEAQAAPQENDVAGSTAGTTVNPEQNPVVAGSEVDQRTEFTPSGDPTGNDSKATFVENEWHEMVDEVNKPSDTTFKELAPELQKQWSDALEDGYASVETANNIVDVHKNNMRSFRKQKFDYDVVNENEDVLRQGILNGVDSEELTDILKRSKITPVVVSSAADTVDLVAIDTDRTLGFDDRRFGAINHHAKQTTKGSYFIVDEGSNKGYLMSKSGKIMDTVPFLKNANQNKTNQIRLGGVAIGSFSKVNVRDNSRKKKTQHGHKRGGLHYPDNIDVSLASGNFSGDVYFVKAKGEVTRTTSVKMGHTKANMQLTQLMKGKKTFDKELMDQLIQASKGSFYETIFKKLKPHVTGVNLGTEAMSPNTGGYYARDRDIVVINTNGEGNMQLSMHVIAHELTHAATVKILAKNKGTFKKLVSQLNDEMEFVEGNKDTGQIYGFTNIYEFVSEAFTNPSFRDYLDSLESVDEQDSVLGSLTDKIAKSLNIKNDSSSDQISDMIELLFTPSREVERLTTDPLGITNYAGWDDISNRLFRNVHEPSVFPTRRRKVKGHFRGSAKLKMIVSDNSAKLLDTILYKTDIFNGQGEYDNTKVYRDHAKISGLSQHIQQKFQMEHSRNIENITANLYHKYKNNSSLFSHKKITEITAYYVSLTHVEAATKATIKQHQLDLESAEGLAVEAAQYRESLEPAENQKQQEFGEDYRESKAYLESISDENAQLLEVIQAKENLAEIHHAQANNGLGVDGQPTSYKPAVQLGQTISMAKRQMKKFENEIAGETGKINGNQQVREDLQELRQAYNEAYRNILDMRYKAGEVTAHQIASYKVLGLDVDFISAMGVTYLDDQEGAKTASTAFGAGGKIGDAKTHAREGRLSAPDDAWVNLQRSIYRASFQIASRDFRETMLEHVQQGDFDEVGAKHSTKEMNAPEGIRPIMVRDGETVHRFYIDDVATMDSIRGVADFDFNGIRFGEFLRKAGKFNQTWQGFLTRYNPAFAPVNSVKEHMENTSNLLARDVRDADGNKLDGKALKRKIRANFARQSLSLDAANVFRKRLFGNSVVRDESADTKLGERMLELESLGGLTTMLEQADIDFENNRNSKVAKQVLVDFFSKDAKNKDFTPTQVAKHLKAAGYRGGQMLEITAQVFRFHNAVFDIRSKTAAYSAMVDMGVVPEEAAFHTRNLLDFTKKGKLTMPLSIMYPFFKSRVGGSANLARSLAKGKGWDILGRQVGFWIVVGYALQSMAPEDEHGNNCMDGLDPHSMRTSLPLFTHGGKDGKCGGKVKVPVGYGMPYVANTIAQTILRKLFSKDDTTSNLDYMGNVASAFVEELVPNKGEMGATDSADNLLKWMVYQMSPVQASGAVNVMFNSNAFGNAINYTHSDKVQDHQAGRVMTPEFYKGIAQGLNDMPLFSPSFTPETIREVLQGFFVGELGYALDAVESSTSVGRGLKGKPKSAHEKLGVLTFTGVEKLWGGSRPLETSVFYKKKKQYVEELRKIGVISIKDPKLNKSGSVSKRLSRHYNWSRSTASPEKTTAIKELILLSENTDKLLRKYSSMRNRLYDHAVIEQRRSRRKRGLEDMNYIVEAEYLQKREQDFSKIYNEQLELQQEFIEKSRALEKKHAYSPN